MEPYDTFPPFYQMQSASLGWQPHPAPNQGADTRSGDSSPSAAPSRPTSQAERAAMHPDRHDLEWHYCRGPWVG